jgi:hypothetical protein
VKSEPSRPCGHRRTSKAGSIVGGIPSSRVPVEVRTCDKSYLYGSKSASEDSVSEQTLKSFEEKGPTYAAVAAKVSDLPACTMRVKTSEKDTVNAMVAANRAVGFGR